MKVVYHENHVEITGDYHPYPIYLTHDVVEQFISPKEAFHAYQGMSRWLPYRGSRSHPLTLRAWELAQENARLGRRHWRWGTRVKWPWSYTGYYYEQDGAFVFPDHNITIPAYA